jgi:hypothetical protein
MSPHGPQQFEHTIQKYTVNSKKKHKKTKHKEKNVLLYYKLV